jgi:hypothetical protein
MSTAYVDGNLRSFPANTALAKGIRVKMTAGFLAAASSTEVELGTLEYAILTGDESGTVRLRSASGTKPMVAAGAITSGNPVYAAASGKVDASGTVFCGTALESATANNDQIEVLPGPNTDISTALSGTSAAAFEVDNDGAYPSIELAAQTGGTGDFKATIKPPATLTAARVFTLDGDANATIANIAGAQTFTNKTLTAPAITDPVIADTPGASTAAAGTTTADAGVLPSGTSRLYPTTAADDTKGVRIAATDKVTGRCLFIGNGVSNKILKVYPPSGGTINGAAADAAFSSASGKGVIIYCLSSGSNTWLAF